MWKTVNEWMKERFQTPFFLLSHNCVLIGSHIFSSSFPQIYPSPRDLNQLSVSFSCLLNDNHVCHILCTSYHSAVCLQYYKQYRNQWIVSSPGLKVKKKSFSVLILNVFSPVQCCSSSTSRSCWAFLLVFASQPCPLLTHLYGNSMFPWWFYQGLMGGEVHYFPTSSTSWLNNHQGNCCPSTAKHKLFSFLSLLDAQQVKFD